MPWISCCFSSSSSLPRAPSAPRGGLTVAALVFLALAGCAAETETDSHGATAAQESAPPGRGAPTEAAAGRWRRLNLGARLQQRMVVQRDAHGDVVQSCASTPKSEASSQP